MGLYIAIGVAAFFITAYLIGRFTDWLEYGGSETYVFIIGGCLVGAIFWPITVPCIAFGIAFWAIVKIAQKGRREAND